MSTNWVAHHVIGDFVFERSKFIMLIEPDVSLIAKYLKDDFVVAVPTETVYGLAVSLDSMKAIEEMNRIKKREDKIYTLMVANIEDIGKYALVSDVARDVIEKYMPGKITVVLPKNSDFKNEYFDSYDTVGIRIPKHTLMLDLLKMSGPLLVSSANISKQSPCFSSEEVLDKLEVDIVVRGKSGAALPSTVVKITDEIKILRQGDIVLDI